MRSGRTCNAKNLIRRVVFWESLARVVVRDDPTDGGEYLLHRGLLTLGWLCHWPRSHLGPPRARATFPLIRQPLDPPNRDRGISIRTNGKSMARSAMKAKESDREAPVDAGATIGDFQPSPDPSLPAVRRPHACPGVAHLLVVDHGVIDLDP